MDLSGKSILVTGAARRLGRAIALELAGAGAHSYSPGNATGGSEEAAKFRAETTA